MHRYIEELINFDTEQIECVGADKLLLGVIQTSEQLRCWEGIQQGSIK